MSFFCGKRDGDGHLFWKCTFLPSSKSGNFLSSLHSCHWIEATGPVVYFGMGGYLVLDDDPWASSFGDLAFGKLERCLGAYPVDFSGSWTTPEYWDADDIALEMSDHPDGGFEVAGAGVFLPASELAFDGLVWTAEEYGDARLERCRVFLPVPGVMHTV